MFRDESLLSIEYLFQADGYRRADFERQVQLFRLLSQVTQVAPSSVTPSLLQSGSQGIPQKLSFEPLGRHHAFITFQKPKIRDDFTASLTVIASVQDLSGLASPSLSWSAREWVTLTLAAFVPFPGPRGLGIDLGGGEYLSEYSLVPFKYRALFEARLFY
jgi:hypothetical protein